MGRMRDGLGSVVSLGVVALAFGAGPALGGAWGQRGLALEPVAPATERPPVSIVLSLPPAPEGDPGSGASGEPVDLRDPIAPGPSVTPARQAAPAPAGPSRHTTTKREVHADREQAAAALARARERCAEAGGGQDGIVATGPGSWTVHRDVIRRYSRDWSSLDTLGWSRPHAGPDGRNDGMLIGGVRCGSDLHRAGLRAGDVVHSVNGRAVRSVPEAVVVYAAVRGDREVSVEISRKGERRTLTYRLIG